MGGAGLQPPLQLIYAEFTTVVMKRILSVGDLSTTDSVDFDRADGQNTLEKTRKVANADRSNKATTGSELEPDSHSVCTLSADGQSSMLGQLCISEFSINPQIVSTCRLGKSSDDRVKPLLVSLSSSEVADDIIKRAKLLRRSTVSTVRDNVFINRNLTKIEAQLAYNERCQRRQRLSLIHI